MKRRELKKVIKEITRVVIKEFLSSSEFSLNRSSIKNNPPQSEQLPIDQNQLSPAEKAELERQKRKESELKLKGLEAERAVKEKEKEFAVKNADNLQKRTLPDINKQIQNIKSSGL